MIVMLDVSRVSQLLQTVIVSLHGGDCDFRNGGDCSRMCYCCSSC